MFIIFHTSFRQASASSIRKSLLKHKKQFAHFLSYSFPYYLFLWVVFYIKSNSFDRDDLFQEGCIGLMLAAEKYKPNVDKPCKFITYAVYWIYQKINRFIKYKNTNEEISLNAPTSNDGNNQLMDYIEGVDYSFENVEEKIYIKQLHKELNQVMIKYITLKEREILKMHYGWNGTKRMTLQEIGDIFNVTRSSIDNCESIARGKIRRSPWGVNKFKEYS